MDTLITVMIAYAVPWFAVSLFFTVKAVYREWHWVLKNPLMALWKIPRFLLISPALVLTPAVRGY